MNPSSTEQAFWRLVERQAHERGRPLSPFSRQTAASVLTGTLAALADHRSGTPRYQVVSAPTGSGKSSFGCAAIGALIEADPDASALFLCDTIDQCEDTFHELAKLVPLSELAIWTGAHDAAKSEVEIGRERGFVPVARFHASDLPRHRVVVVTHSFYKGGRGGLSRTFAGRPRTLTIVDERPKEVAVFDLDQGDAGKARDWAVERFGGASPAVDAFRALHDYLGEAWEAERTSDRANYRALLNPDLAWFGSDEAEEVFREAPDSLPGVAIGFARALATGYAFMSRYEGSPTGGRFVGYHMALPIEPGTVLLDATSDIDGVSSLVPWRSTVPSPKLAFDNLEITLLSPPAEVVRPNERISTLMKTARRAAPYAEWIKAEVVRRTVPGEGVLVVVHKALLAHAYLPDKADLGEGAFDLEGRKVAFINWGYGIGSNRWKEASSVFLFGEFHVPKRTTVALTLGLLNQPAGSPRLQRLGSPNSQDEAFLAISQGHLLRWEKQLAMRGNARNITADGVCGRQRLFVTSEFRRFMRHRELLFPGASFVVDTSAKRAAERAGGAEALAALLATSETDRLTSHDVQGACGLVLQKSAARLLAAPVVVETMRAGGWRYVPGGGRGRPSFFERAAA